MTDVWEELGRSIACFKDGPYFAYQESMDAMPAYAKTELCTATPEISSLTDHGICPETRSRDQQREEWDKYPSLFGVFALTHETRMVVH